MLANNPQSFNKGGEFEYNDLEDVDEFDEQEALEDKDIPLVFNQLLIHSIQSQQQELQEIDQTSSHSLKSFRQLDQKSKSDNDQNEAHSSKDKDSDKLRITHQQRNLGAVNVNSISVPHRDKKSMKDKANNIEGSRNSVSDAQQLGNQQLQFQADKRTGNQQLAYNQSQQNLLSPLPNYYLDQNKQMAYSHLNSPLQQSHNNNPNNIYDYNQFSFQNNQNCFMTPQHYIPNIHAQSVDVKCDCLEKLRLKVEQELDKLRGEFRKKEVELIAPLLNKYMQIEQKLEGMKSYVNTRVRECEQGMLVQEQTIELIINSISTLTSANLQQLQSASNSMISDSILGRSKDIQNANQSQLQTHRGEPPQKEYNYPLQAAANQIQEKISPIEEDVAGESMRARSVLKDMSGEFSIRLESKEALSQARKDNEIDAEESRINQNDMIDRDSVQYDEDHDDNDGHDNASEDDDDVPSADLSQSNYSYQQKQLNTEVEQESKSNNEQLVQNQKSSLMSPSNNQNQRTKNRKQSVQSAKTRVSTMRSNILNHLQNATSGPKLLDKVNTSTPKGYYTNNGPQNQEQLMYQDINQYMQQFSPLSQQRQWQRNRDGNLFDYQESRGRSPLKFYATSPYTLNDGQVISRTNPDWTPGANDSQSYQQQYQDQRFDIQVEDQQLMYRNYLQQQLQQQQIDYPLQQQQQDAYSNPTRYYEQEREKLELMQLKHEFEQSLMKTQEVSNNNRLSNDHYATSSKSNNITPGRNNLDMATQRIQQFNQSLSVRQSYSGQGGFNNPGRGQGAQYDANDPLQYNRQEQELNLPFSNDRNFYGNTQLKNLR